MNCHILSTALLAKDPKYLCVTRCGLSTGTVCSLACMTCKIVWHTDDMLTCVALQGRAASFVCDKLDMAAMHAWIRVNFYARALKPRQLKEKRARAKNAMAVTTSGSESRSHQAAHVARSAIVYDAGLGGAATQPRARDADLAMDAARDVGAAVGAARLAGALAADRVRHGNRAVPAPGVVRTGGSANNLKEARAAALANLDRTFQSMQQPKYTPV